MDKTTLDRLEALAVENNWDGCPDWDAAMRTVKRYKTWQEVWDKHRVGGRMLEFLDGLGATDPDDPPTKKAKRFEDEWRPDISAGQLANLVRKHWPKAPRLSKVTTGGD